MILLTASIISVAGQEKQLMKNSDDLQPLSNTQPYNGYLRVYIIEPDSRWNMYDGNPYHYAFLDFAYNDMVSINYLGTYTDSITYKGDFENDNVMVVATVFNPEPHLRYSNPASSHPYEAHYVDATAGAYPGETGSNTANEDVTHTVFIEYATAQSCEYCPFMGDLLYSIYESGDYPFFYVSLVGDKSPKAFDYLVRNYNVYQYPSEYVDGGSFLLNYEDEEFTRQKIEAAGLSTVHDLDLSVSVEAVSNGELKIDVSITNLEEFPDMSIIEVENLKGRFLGLRAIVTNIGNLPDTNFDWKIHVIKTKGFLTNDFFTTSGVIDELNPGDEVTIRTDEIIFGLARIRIEVVAHRSVIPIYALVLGPFILY